MKLKHMCVMTGVMAARYKKKINRKRISFELYRK